LDDLRAVPAYEDDPSFYVDWGDAREYTIGDLGVGECAGEVVSFAEFGLADSEREVFQAQLSLEEGQSERAAEQAYQAMILAAKALVREHNIDVSDDPATVVSEFRSRLHDTKIFHDPYAGAKFANYLFRVHSEQAGASNGAGNGASNGAGHGASNGAGNGTGGSNGHGVDRERAHRTIEEAQLFIEAAHACYDRMQQGA
ncbi:MAG: hypothetical protein AAGC55_16090, partial [Myxococcota bacterium]